MIRAGQIIIIQYIFQKQNNIVESWVLLYASGNERGCVMGSIVICGIRLIQNQVYLLEGPKVGTR